jgi:hypothetical protein
MTSSIQVGTTVNEELRRRASLVIPGGMYGHQNARDLPKGYPQLFASSEGPFVRDVDGNQYIDLLCRYGPVILGHQYPAVEEAARRQRLEVDCLNGPNRERVRRRPEVGVTAIGGRDRVRRGARETHRAVRLAGGRVHGHGRAAGDLAARVAEVDGAAVRDGGHCRGVGGRRVLCGRARPREDKARRRDAGAGAGRERDAADDGPACGRQDGEKLSLAGWVVTGKFTGGMFRARANCAGRA